MTTNVSVVDLSETGCRFYAPSARLREQQVIALTIQTIGPFDATVVWAEAGLFGVRFTKQLYGPVFDHIRTKLDNPTWRPEG